MRPLFSIALAAALALGAATSVSAQTNTDMKILAEKIKADKKLLVAANMKLTDAEATKFWPIYDAHQRVLQDINKRIGAVIEAYAKASPKGSVSDAVAKELLDRMLIAKTEEVNVLTSSASKLRGVLPETKIARYIQIENKIRALLNYELASAVPLIY
jgi:Spy/CpxP family protein refolding chaperone